MHNPKEVHMEEVIKKLRCLKLTPSNDILFKKSKRMTLEVYIDADWAESVIDRSSIFRYCTFLVGNLVRGEKQSMVARLSVEAEF